MAPTPEAVRAVGAQLKEARLRKYGERVAKAARAIGLSDRTITRIERGVRDGGTAAYTPSGETVATFARGVGVDPAPLLEVLGYDAAVADYGRIVVPAELEAIKSEMDTISKRLDRIEQLVRPEQPSPTSEP